VGEKAEIEQRLKEIMEHPSYKLAYLDEASNHPSSHLAVPRFCLKKKSTQSLLKRKN